jgi:NPCBM/NEW2 domain/Cellulase (glycosyl hydrolase family 5)
MDIDQKLKISMTTAFSLALGLALVACGTQPPPEAAGSAPQLGSTEVLFGRPLKAGFLSDQGWSSVSNGWGPVERDASNGEAVAGDGRPLSMGGILFRKGLGVHAPSTVVFSLDPTNGCTRFSAVVGLDDEIRRQSQYGSARFQIWMDGAQVWESGLLNGSGAPNTQAVDVAVSGRSTLELRVTDGGDGSAYDHADWADARIECGGAPPPTQGISSNLPYARGVNLAGADFGESVLPGVFGSEYTYPDQNEVDYFSARGMTIYRLPFLWERLQRGLNAALDPDELARLDAFVTATTAKGKTVILDPHNYARYHGQLIGSGEVPNAAFADFWRRLAAHYKGNRRVVFGLMNEPYSKRPAERFPGQQLPVAQWVDAANAAIVAIRSTGAGNTIQRRRDAPDQRFWQQPGLRGASVSGHLRIWHAGRLCQRDHRV